METANIVVLGVLDKAPDLGLLKVVKVVVVSGTEVSAETAVVASDDNSATTGRLAGVDAVLNAEAGLLDGIVEGGGVLVVAGTTQVDDAVGGQDVLGTTSGVLGGTAGDEFGVVVGQEVFVEGNMLLLGQNSVIGLEVVLLEESFVTEGLDVCRGNEPRVSQRVLDDISIVECYYPEEDSPGREEKIPWERPL